MLFIDHFLFAYRCAFFLDGFEQKSTMEQMAKASEMMRNVCVGKTKAPMDLIDGLGRGEFPENKELKCYANCVLEMMQAVSSYREPKFQ